MVAAAFLCAVSAVSDLSYFLLPATWSRIITFGPFQDWAAAREHFGTMSVLDPFSA
jgi:hypothetical protein